MDGGLCQGRPQKTLTFACTSNFILEIVWFFKNFVNFPLVFSVCILVKRWKIWMSLKFAKTTKLVVAEDLFSTICNKKDAGLPKEISGL